MKMFIRKINNFKFYNIFHFNILLDKADASYGSNISDFHI